MSNDGSSPRPWKYDGEHIVDASGNYVAFHSSDANGNLIATAVNAHDALVEALTFGLTAIMANQFPLDGGTECTSWGVCSECGQADYRGHKPDCLILEIITKMQSALALAQSSGNPGQVK